MRLVQIISSLDNEAAGTTAWLRRLVQELAARELEVSVLTTSAAAKPAGTASFITAFRPDAAGVPGLRTLLGSRALHRAIADTVRSPGTVLHSSGLWRLPNVYPGWVAARTGTPLVVSPHGMLGPEALVFSPTRKRLFSALVQRQALAAATCWHATSLREVDDIRAYGVTAPIALVPIGIDVPPEPREPVEASADGQRTVLYLGRLHPQKGLDSLLRAWALVEARHPGWRLRIVGPSELGQDRFLQGEARRLGLTHVNFEDGLFGDSKFFAYQDADIVVLPSRGENFGVVVAEALAQGTPVVCSTGAPWAGLETHRCGWWVEQGPEPIAAALASAMAMPREALRDMGARGRQWMLRDFAWSRIAADMEMLYRWCLTKGEAPPFLHFADGQRRAASAAAEIPDVR